MFRSSSHRPPVRRTVTPFACVLSTALLLTSCVSGGGGDGSDNKDADGSKGSDGNGQGQDPVASSTITTTGAGNNLQIDVNSLERHGQNFTVLKMSVQNLDDEEVRVGDIFNMPSRLGGVRYTADAVTLVDPKNNNRYYPLSKSSDEECLCSDWGGTEHLKPEDTFDLWVAFPQPPKDVSSMIVTTPVTPEFLDVPIDKVDTPNTDITNTDVEKPKILPLTSFQDSLDGNFSREDTGDETSIMLSSDVLFDTNESKLKPEAEKALENVAKEVDGAEGKTIGIDGYTDNTGSDSINDPLSEDRAKAVENQLKELVTREGLKYEVAGHGSSDPVADNDTEEGRKKNRRVTISFEK